MKVRPFFRVLLPCMAMVLMLCISATVWAGESYVYGYFQYTVADDSVTITAYTGDEEVVTIPSMIAGNPVNTVASGAFSGSGNTTTVYLPDTIMTVESGAFSAVQSVVFNSGNTAGTVPSADEQDNRTGDISNEDAGSTDNQTDVLDEDGSKTEGAAPEAAPISGIRDGEGNLITTDDEGNLILVDPEGNETVLDDTQKYTIEEGKDGQPRITNQEGDAVTVENGERVSFVDGNRDQVTVDADGNKTVRNEESKYSYEEAEADDLSEAETASGSGTETGTVSEAISETEKETSSEAVSETEGAASQAEAISTDSSVSSEGQSESDSRQGTGGTLPVVILCVAFIAIAVFLIMRRKKHDH